MFFLRIAKQKHLFYIIVAEKRLIFKAFSRCCGQHFSRVAINIPFSAVSLIQYTEGSHRAVEVTLGGFLLPEKRKGGLVYGIQNYAKATGKNQNPCAQDLL